MTRILTRAGVVLLAATALLTIDGSASADPTAPAPTCDESAATELPSCAPPVGPITVIGPDGTIINMPLGYECKVDPDDTVIDMTGKCYRDEEKDGEVNEGGPQVINADPNNTAPSAVDRDANFAYGPAQPGNFDAAASKLWYIQRDTVIELGWWDVTTPDLGDVIWGKTADGAFTVYKFVLVSLLQLIGYLAFGLLFIQLLLQWALNFAQDIKDHLVTPFGLSIGVMAIAAVYAASQWAMKRHGRALAEYTMSAGVLALAGLLVPGEVVRWIVSLVAGASAVVLMVATGRDPTGIAGPSTGTIDAAAISNAYHGFTDSLTRTLIGRVAEILTFGKALPDACRPAYETGLALHSYVTDPANLAAMQAIDTCKPYVDAALRPDASRAVYAIVLVIWAVIFAIVMAWLTWPSVKGQLLLMIATASSPLLVIAVALPGTIRATAMRLVVKMTLGITALVVLSLYLSVCLIGINAVLVGTDTWPMSWRLVAMTLIPAALIAIKIKQGKTKLGGDRIIQKMTNAPAKPDSARTLTTNATKFATKLAKTAVVAGTGGTAAGVWGATKLASKGAITATKGVSKATAFTVKQTAKAATSGLAGTEQRAGIILGPKTLENPVVNEPETPAPTPPTKRTTRLGLSTPATAVEAPANPLSVPAPADRPERVKATLTERTSGGLAAKGTMAMWDAAARRITTARDRDADATALRQAAARNAANATLRPTMQQAER